MPSKRPLHQLKRIFSIIYSPYGIALQVSACLFTYALVVTDFDYHYLLWIQSAPLRNFLFGGVIIGGLLPMFVLPSILLVSSLYKYTKGILLSSSLFLSAFLGWLLSSFYKAWTGRVQPHVHEGIFVNNSHDWNFGFFEHGIFWGWPSSHTTVAFAMTTSLIIMYPKNKTVATIAVLYAFYVGIGVTTRIHWFSEFVAGSILGTLIGYAVGITILTQKKKLL
jgi:membrane-associated phospholipid phosphatase